MQKHIVDMYIFIEYISRIKYIELGISALEIYMVENKLEISDAESNYVSSWILIWYRETNNLSHS